MDVVYVTLKKYFKSSFWPAFLNPKLQKYQICQILIKLKKWSSFKIRVRVKFEKFESQLVPVFLSLSRLIRTQL